MRALASGSEVALADRHDALLVDLDGVVYVGAHAIEHAIESLTTAAARGAHPAYVTNNASRTPETVAAHLAELGLGLTPADVVTSAQAAVRLVAERFPAGSPVLAVGGPGVAAALEHRGFTVVSSADDRPVAVVQGYGPEVGWPQLAEASYAVAAGALHIATNLDLSIPTPRGRAPGNGTLVAAVQRATGVVPLVAGKPESALMLESVERIGGTAPLTVGDRLDTDIEAAVRLGMPSLLVLTGVTGSVELLGARPHERPTYLARDLRGLLEPHPPVAGTGVDGDRARCRQAQVLVREGRITVEHAGPDPVDLLRAAAVAAWSSADRGAPCHPGEAGEAISQAAAVGHAGSGGPR